MNLKRFLLLSIFTYGMCALWAITGVQGNADPIQTPSVPSTVTLGMLTPQQLEDRAEELTTTTTSTTTSTTTRQLAPFRLLDLPTFTRTPNAKNGSRLRSLSDGPTTLRP